MPIRKHQIELQVEDLSILKRRSKRQCYRIYKSYQDLLGKKRGQKITIWEYCSIEGIKQRDEVYEALGIKH